MPPVQTKMDLEGVLHIPQSSRITIKLFSVIIRTHVGVGESYPFIEMQSVYSTDSANWVIQMSEG